MLHSSWRGQAMGDESRCILLINFVGVLNGPLYGKLNQLLRIT
jgi:hypothetical protein